MGELGLGLGFGELGFGLGVPVEVPLGVGLFVAGVDDAAEFDEDAEVDVDGLDDGLPLAELRDAEAFAVADLLADFLGLADDLADLNGESDESANAVAERWLAALFVAPESTVLFGMSGQGAELMID